MLAFRYIRWVETLAGEVVNVIERISASIDDDSDYEPANKQKVLGHLSHLLRLRASIARFDVKYQGIVEFIAPVTTALAVAYGSYMTFQGGSAIGSLFAVVLVAGEMQDEHEREHFCRRPGGFRDR